MKMMRLFISLLVAIALVPGVARSQQMNASASVVPASFPTGITVVASGNATAKNLLNVYTVMPKQPHATPSGLERELESVGLPSSAITLPPLGSGTVEAAPAMDRSIRAAVTKAGWMTTADPVTTPADLEATTREALAQALRNARLKAEAIAAADGRHIGKLLNVQPAPLDYYTGIAEKLATINPFANQPTGPTVSESGVFTFELLP